MDASTRTFLAHRPRLRSLAYRMLGSVAEAEDVVQDTWLRWQEADPAAIETPEAWLVTATSRLSIDRLRALKRQRADYPGLWLPEPIATGEASTASPEDTLERLGEVSAALLALLERLTPEARAAFLLREVFDADYADIARLLGTSEANCRQRVLRARRALGDAVPARPASADEHRRLVEAFADAAASGRFDALQELLAADAELRGDGGGRVRSVGHPLHGARRIAQLYLATFLRHRARQRLAVVELNGRPGLLRFIDGRLESAQSLVVAQGRITRLDVQRNPEKLRRLAAAFEPGA
ncbi:RNA polymerase sigma factor SigJ [Piscinibacter sakaiensis]|uniref:Putative RNA polymerase sigma factor n=1 Tax=Piscinibacter sakaiensis TaxID=1547922 RepID=A0A0K8NX99_PISS1|nr:RNA polymerase sigma factor SigJ [Piscinibacter sakaiensis]GAP35003.1 putative RNA polymerase sigma factor [Piscinibacter sakaiensis]